MAQTYGELITELIALPHSKDMFELEKECTELSIMEKYIDNQMYLRENFADFINADYMMEATDESKFSKILGRLKEGTANIGKRIWDLIMRLMDMIKRAATAVSNWFNKIMNKKVFSKCATILSKGLSKKSSGSKTSNSKSSSSKIPESESSSVKSSSSKSSSKEDEAKTESVVYEEADKDRAKEAVKKDLKRIMDDPKIPEYNFNDMDKVYKKIKSLFNFARMNAFFKYDKGIIKNPKYKEAFNEIKDMLVLKSANSSDGASIYKFLINPTNESEEAKYNKMKEFLDICKIGPFIFRYEFDENNTKLPIISIEDFCKILDTTKEKFRKLFSSRKGIYASIHDANSWIGLISTLCLIVYGKTTGISFGSIAMYSLIALVFDYIFFKVADQIANIASIHRVDNPKYISKFDVNLENVGNKLYETTTSYKNEMEKSFKDAQMILKKYSEKYKDYIINNNEIRNVTKDSLSKFFAMIGIKYETLDKFDNFKDPASYAIYIKKYYEIEANIMTLVNLSQSISNLIYNMAKEIIKNYDGKDIPAAD